MTSPTQTITNRPQYQASRAEITRLLKQPLP